MRTVDTHLGPQCDLHTLLDTYAVALDRAGATLLMVGRMRDDEAGRVMDRVDGMVVTGGRDLDPALYGQDNTAGVGIYAGDDTRDIALIRGAYERKMPVLAICRGLQAVNVALGGELHQHMLSDSDPEHPTPADKPMERNAHRHMVDFAQGCRLAAVYGEAERAVNSLQPSGDLAARSRVDRGSPHSRRRHRSSGEHRPHLAVAGGAMASGDVGPRRGVRPLQRLCRRCRNLPSPHE